MLPEYTALNCCITASQASVPGKMKTPRNNLRLCALLNARNARKSFDGVLSMGALLSTAPDNRIQSLEFSLIVSPNSRSHPLQSGRCGGLSETQSGVLIKPLR